MNREFFIGGHRGSGCTDHSFYQTHRAIKTLPVENTLASFRRAYHLGADYIETDIVMSADGVLFTLHNVKPEDHFFGSDRPGKLLSQLSFKQFSCVKTGRYHSGDVATLAEALAVIAELDPQTAPWAVNLELKGVQGSGEAYEQNDYLARIAKEIASSPLPASRVLFSSFALQNIMSMSQYLPDSSYGMLFTEKSDAPRAIYADHQDMLTHSYIPFTAELVRDVLNIWGQRASSSAKLGYLHPEVTTINEAMIELVVKERLGLNCWALFETLKAERKALYADILFACYERGAKLSIITDYLEEFTQIAA